MDPIVKRPSSQEVLDSQDQTLVNGVEASSVSHFQQDPSQTCDPISQTDKSITHMVSSEQLQQEIITTSRNPDFGEHNTDDTLRTSQAHDEVDKGSTGSVSRECGHKSFCCNFPRGRCFHGANCSHLQSEYTTFVKPEYDWCVKFHQEIQAASENPVGNASISEVAEPDLASLCGKAHASLMDADANVLNKNCNSEMNDFVNHEVSENGEVKQVLETSSKLKKRKKHSKSNELQLTMHSSGIVDPTSSFLDKRTDEVIQALKNAPEKREEGHSIGPEEPMKESNDPSTQVRPSGSCEEASERDPGIVSLPVVLDEVKQSLKSSSKKIKKGDSISPEEPKKESVDPSTQVMPSGSCEETSVTHPGVEFLPVALEEVKQALKSSSKKRKKGHSTSPEEPMKESIDPSTLVMPSGSCEETSVSHPGVVSLPVVLDEMKQSSKRSSKKRKKGDSISTKEPMKESIDPSTQVMPSGSCEETSVKHSGVAFLPVVLEEVKQALKSSSKKRKKGLSTSLEESMKESIDPSTLVLPSGSCEETSVSHPGLVSLPVVLDEVKQALKSSSNKRKKGHSTEEPMKESFDPSTQVMPSGSCEEASVRHPGAVSIPVVLDDVKQALKSCTKKRKIGHSISLEEPMKESIDPSTLVMLSGSCEETSVRHPGVTSLPVVLDDSKNAVETNIVNNAITANHYLQKSHLSSKEAVLRSKRKLLVLDLNGLLADLAPMNGKSKADVLLSGKEVYRRPFYEDFIDFCFERFDVGVWSSRKWRNIIRLVDILMGEKKKHLLFCWDESQCTKTGYNTLENNKKPLVLKELKKLWEQHRPNVPWDTGYYNETNTVLLDDSPYKALRNPPNTAIFPHPYTFRNVYDNSLGPKGDLRLYLARLAEADDTQKFICENPFGQRSLINSKRNWSFYSKIVSPQLQNPQKKNNASGTNPRHPKKKRKPRHPKKMAPPSQQQGERPVILLPHSATFLADGKFS